ncbi:TIGR03087 family PEP-CTERM/XrtA system glycosyltransferase [Aestuariibacter sp. AA17]|uniref:TIGR03087 family PEP-CTERM/XrtA system glycosyltransferase n=1 Tax=Fluctibacter corallii TaxID=2984329 RepID=A0ABT3ABK1_9ALTE|nr:TIGR03087 family PEP-CTERM/XrtA system glycosyltransferase [Aestuariibacter sp. AA17]MCV2886046.1 TIGR03087 family PEP-CTERM/XrtA system glycosyltransferase [Aestuariibacter sp. AA17]
MKKTPLLYLCHRIPFPPNKGDKIRSFNILKKLSEQFDIYLGAFVDDPYDWQYASKLNAYCKDVFLLNQNKLLCKVKGTAAFLTGEAISVPYYGSRKMQQWVNKTIAAQNIDNIFIYSSVMAQFVTSHAKNAHVVVDFVDVDSDKWRQYAEGKQGLAKWVYAREHKTLQKFENTVTAFVEHALFVSPQEADLFKQQLPETLRNRVSGMLNGVDSAFFDPTASFDEEVNEAINVAFTGAMDYWANVDAVLWFVEHVWPKVREKQPQATFYVVGGNPTAQILALDGKNGIVVTGRVKDVRPYIAEANVIVAPLQIARGIQNKVLEAMAMAKPVVATSMAMEGIGADTPHAIVEDEPTRFAQQVTAYIDTQQTAQSSRDWILDTFQWHNTLEQLDHYFNRA